VPTAKTLATPKQMSARTRPNVTPRPPPKATPENITKGDGAYIMEGKTIGPHEMEPEWTEVQLKAIDMACA